MVEKPPASPAAAGKSWVEQRVWSQGNPFPLWKINKRHSPDFAWLSTKIPPPLGAELSNLQKGQMDGYVRK